jgi:acyl-CoA dehydrogenase
MSLGYKAPLDDMQFILQDVLKLSERKELFGETEISNELIDAVLQEMEKFSTHVVLPLNASGDHEGCKLVDGQVITPNGFKEAYLTFMEGGWIGMTCSTEIGGLGLPHALQTAVGEMISAVNPGFGMYTGMNKGAIAALQSSGSPDLLKTYLPKLVSGEWTATMNLTEPQAGTDLGLLKTKAILQADGSYKITGSKIFISGGDHDFTDNIIHLVLARVSGAPGGSKGISLFVVPKFLVNTDGSLGSRNAAYCTGLEKKMGLKGSATCSISFEGCEGYIVGCENSGLKTMFSMMNTMRIAVGGQGVSHANIAYQNASRYSKERLQGRAPGSTNPSDQPEPIVRLPDVRRMLMSARSFSEGGRAFTSWMGLQLDIAETSPNKEERTASQSLLALLTPVLKGYLTEVSEEVISMCLQCFGGHGYITETGVEQIYRDARIAKIYEGATGVQAIDLLGRKVLMDRGESLAAFITLVKITCSSCDRHDNLQPFSTATRLAIDDLEDVTQWLFNNVTDDINLAGSASHHYLLLMGLVTTGYMWCMMALTAHEQLQQDKGNPFFLRNKITTGKSYIALYMPDSQALVKKIKAGADVVMSLDEEAI